VQGKSHGLKVKEQSTRPTRRQY